MNIWKELRDVDLAAELQVSEVRICNEIDGYVKCGIY